MEQEILERAGQLRNFIETSDGKVTFTMDCAAGDLVALLIDEIGEFTILKMDRSQDKSNELYLDVLKRWIADVSINQLRIVDVGELIVDDTDPFITYLSIDDNLLAYITTYPLPEDTLSRVEIYSRPDPERRWYMHIAHQGLVNGRQYGDGVTIPLANVYLSERSQRARGLSSS